VRVIVIGAGAVGTCVAYQLAVRGASVTLVDADDPQRTLSAHSFGWVNPVLSHTDAYFALSSAALVSHQRLADDVGRERWFFRTGNLHWADSPDGSRELLAVAASYRKRGWPVHTYTPEHVLSRLEPHLRLGQVAGPLIFYPDDAYLHTDRFLTVVQDACRDLGASVVVRDWVVELLGSPVRGVRLASGRRLAADVVVCCAGRGSADLLSQVGAAIPMVEPDDAGITTRGLLVRTSPLPPSVSLGRVLHAPGLSIRPHTGRRLVLHSHDVDDTLPAAPETAASELLVRLAEVIPGASGVRVESAFVGVRPMPRDGMSVVGWASGADSVYVVVTHSGLTLAPILGEVAAREVLDGPHALAAAFRPDRFPQLREGRPAPAR
jgi:glycine/D-amino acid oxidase-like deaminating enzyme